MPGDQREQDVFQGGEVPEEPGFLEDDPHPSAPPVPVGAEPSGDGPALPVDFSGRRPLEQGDDGEERGLSGAGGAEDKGGFPGAEVGGDSVEDRTLGPVGPPPGKADLSAAQPDHGSSAPATESATSPDAARSAGRTAAAR